MLQRGLALARAHQGRNTEAYALWILGKIAAQGAPSERTQAEGHYRQALALADALGMRPLAAHCHLGLGTLYSQMERLEEARSSAVHGDRDVPHHGDDLVVATGRSNTGADRMTSPVDSSMRSLQSPPFPLGKEGGTGQAYSTVTDLARLRGWSTSHPRSMAQ